MTPAEWRHQQVVAQLWLRRMRALIAGATFRKSQLRLPFQEKK